MIKVQRFFKRTENRPFTYPSIEERKQGTNHTLWIIGIVLIIVIGVIAFLIF